MIEEKPQGVKMFSATWTRVYRLRKARLAWAMVGSLRGLRYRYHAQRRVLAALLLCLAFSAIGCDVGFLDLTCRDAGPRPKPESVCRCTYTDGCRWVTTEPSATPQNESGRTAAR